MANENNFHSKGIMLEVRAAGVVTYDRLEARRQAEERARTEAESARKKKINPQQTYPMSVTGPGLFVTDPI